MCGGVDEDVSKVGEKLRRNTIFMITDWLMVIITAVYVVATIFICWANIKSARATREQLAETKRQYEEEHRPYISYQFFFERRTWYGMRFTNYGKRVANHVQIKLDQEFLDSISNTEFIGGLRKLQDKELTLGIGQSYEIFFGASEFRDNPNKKPIAGKIIYLDAKTTYCEKFEIDFENYATFFSVDSSSDVLHNDMKKQTTELTKMSKSLEKIQSALGRIDRETKTDES